CGAKHRRMTRGCFALEVSSSRLGHKYLFLFFFSSRRRHTRLVSDWSSDVCSSDLRSSSLALPAGELLRLALGEFLEPNQRQHLRSEERRVGKECRSRGSAYH